MRVLALSLALFLFCTPALAQFDGDSCFHKWDVETTIGGCGKVKHDYGICADNSGDGSRKRDAFQDLGGTFRGEAEFTAAECEEQYALLCGGADKVVTSGCDQWCRWVKASVVSVTVGCDEDSDCPIPDSGPPDNGKPACCAVLRDVMQNTCSYSDTELDAEVAAMRDVGECADEDCVSAGAHAGASFTTSLVVGALALVTMWRF